MITTIILLFYYYYYCYIIIVILLLLLVEALALAEGSGNKLAQVCVPSSAASCVIIAQVFVIWGGSCNDTKSWNTACGFSCRFSSSGWNMPLERQEKRRTRGRARMGSPGCRSWGRFFASAG